MLQVRIGRAEISCPGQVVLCRFGAGEDVQLLRGIQCRRRTVYRYRATADITVEAVGRGQVLGGGNGGGCRGIAAGFLGVSSCIRRRQ